MRNHKSHTLQVGTVIQDKWIVLEFLGKGGMGEVYRAHQLNLKRDIAIKIISREWLDSVKKNEEELEVGLQRFRNEVLAMAQVRHQNLLQIYDYGSFSVKKGENESKFEYIVMEHVPGGTLRSTMSEEGFYPEEDLVREWLAKYFLPVLNGVEVLHSAGIIHRDLKPGNVLMDGHIPRITDFGLARSSRIRPVTISTDIKGTPAYMSPEHFMDLKRADHRADIYSLGKMLFEAIDGRIGPDSVPLKSAHLPKVESPFFGKLDQIIRTATAEDRNHRYGSVKEFRNAILEAVKVEEPGGKPGKPGQRKRIELPSRPKWIAGGIALAIIMVLALAFWHLFGGPGKTIFKPIGTPPTTSDIKPPDSSLSSSVSAVDTVLSPSIVTGKDDAKLYLIPEGELTLPSDMVKEPGKTVKISPFYMDETEVTNHQYAEFLNRAVSKVWVEEEVVKADGIVWLLLGEVAKGYDPIIFKGGKFTVKEPIYHSHPVVRVTALGAAAYAEYYGRRLPTAAEWLYALKTGDKIRKGALAPAGQPINSHMVSMHGQRQIPSNGDKSLSESPVSVTQSQPDQHGIRGLEGNVNEWGIIAPLEPSQASKGRQYGVLPEAVARHPWEAFKNVGFRTVLPVPRLK